MNEWETVETNELTDELTDISGSAVGEEAAVSLTQPPSTPSFFRSKQFFIWLALLIIVVDQLTKWWVIENIPANTAYIPVESWYPYLQFAHVYNRGAAFGMFQAGAPIFTILSFVVIAGLLVLNFTSPAQNFKLRLALGMVFGGAVGNLIDRLRIGHVTDFIDVNVQSIINVPLADWAIFNVADPMIVFGALLLAYWQLFEAEDADFGIFAAKEKKDEGSLEAVVE